MNNENSKSTHTPGPWTVDGEQVLSGIEKAIVAEVPSLCRGYPLGPVQAANACLISAAPDLLEACKRILLAIGWDIPDSRMTLKQKIDLLQEVIEKAEGEG